jgi:hypothetical protein
MKMAAAALFAAYVVLHAVRRISASKQPEQASKPPAPDKEA